MENPYWEHSQLVQQAKLSNIPACIPTAPGHKNPKCLRCEDVGTLEIFDPREDAPIKGWFVDYCDCPIGQMMRNGGTVPVED